MKSDTLVTVLRDGEERNIASIDLVPGDVILLSGATTFLSCDSVLISGNCDVNESMLTGKSIPVTKVPVSVEDESIFDVSLNKRNILFCGTELLKSWNTDNKPAKVVVYRTGFSTAKGELVREALYPKPFKIKLYTDLLNCFIVLFILGFPTLVYAGTNWLRFEGSAWDIGIFFLTAVSFLLPPAVPAVLTCINIHAQKRLKKEGILCLNTKFINFAGGLDLMCFDKTGTLTEDSLDISVIVPSMNGRFANASREMNETSVDLKKAFACCHSLSNINGQLVGYDLDIKMFKSIGWNLQEPSEGEIVPFFFLPERIVCSNVKETKGEAKEVIALVRQFPFESSFKRMSVVAKPLRSQGYDVYMKGAPEVIASLCQKDTVPENLKDVLQTYSMQGFRIVAFASKTFNEEVSLEDVQKMRRELIETDMKFLGLLVLENKLKEETVPALEILNEANIRMIMITGDNLLTAVAVSRNCGILSKKSEVVFVEASTLPEFISEDQARLQVSYKYTTSSPVSLFEHSVDASDSNDVNLLIERDKMPIFAMEGDTFNLLRSHDTKLLEKIILKCAVFARMSPDQKLHLIKFLQQLGYQVGMCGDGSNDCAALRAAHMGLSISKNEASLSASFISTEQNVKCISTLIREGRATLVSLLDTFRIMVCYTLMFLVSLLMLFWDGQGPSEGAYEIIFVLINLWPPLFIGATGAHQSLSKRQPARSILSFVGLFSIFSFVFIQTCVLAGAYEYIRKQARYGAFSSIKENYIYSDPEPSYTATTILKMTMMGFITAYIILPSGKPFRNKFSSNKLYVRLLIVEFLLATLAFIYPPVFLRYTLKFLRAPTILFNLLLYCVSFAGLFICYFWEEFIVQQFNACRRGPKRRYEKLLKEISEEEWNPMPKNQ